MGAAQSRLDVAENTEVPAPSGNQTPTSHPAASHFTDRADPYHESDLLKSGSLIYSPT